MPQGANPFGNIIQHPGNNMTRTELPPPAAGQYDQPAASVTPQAQTEAEQAVARQDRPGDPDALAQS